MNHKQIDEVKNRNMFLVGSARGVNRFYVTNKFIENFPKAKVINTGVLIRTICKDLGFKNIDNLTLIEYYRFIEPVIVQKILSHLEHTDVILDTHFYYLIPCLSIKALQKISSNIKSIIIIHIEEDPIKIYQQKRGRGDIWFDSFDNINDDLIFNKAYFEFYKITLQQNIKIFTIEIKLENDYDKNIEEFINTLKEQINYNET